MTSILSSQDSSVGAAVFSDHLSEANLVPAVSFEFPVKGDGLWPLIYSYASRVERFFSEIKMYRRQLRHLNVYFFKQFNVTEMAIKVPSLVKYSSYVYNQLLVKLKSVKQCLYDLVYDLQLAWSLSPSESSSDVREYATLAIRQIKRLEEALVEVGALLSQAADMDKLPSRLLKNPSLIKQYFRYEFYQLNSKLHELEKFCFCFKK